jgi:hypothetical protein
VTVNLHNHAEDKGEFDFDFGADLQENAGNFDLCDSMDAMDAMDASASDTSSLSSSQGLERSEEAGNETDEMEEDEEERNDSDSDYEEDGEGHRHRINILVYPFDILSSSSNYFILMNFDYIILTQAHRALLLYLYVQP